MEKIKLNNIFNLSKEEINNCKIELNMSEGRNGQLYIDKWLSLSEKEKQSGINDCSYWPKYGSQSNFHVGQKGFSFVRKSYDEWLFISAATILDVPENRRSNVEILEKYKPLFGRLIMKFHKGNTMGRYTFNLSYLNNKEEVIEILPCIYSGEQFEGYDNVNLPYKKLNDIFEGKIMPTYYDKNEKGYSDNWLKIMKNCIISNAGKFSTARMLQDYVSKMYIPLCNLSNKYYNDLEKVSQYNEWKNVISKQWNNIKIMQSKSNYNDITVDAGNKITVGCEITLPNDLIKIENIDVQVYYGKITEEGVVDDIQITSMKLEDTEKDKYIFSAKIELKNGGDYGYTFRVIPKNEMILDPMNLDLVKWITDTNNN